MNLLEQFTSKKMYLFSTLTISLGIVFSIMYFSKDTLRSVKDLQVLSVELKNSSFNIRKGRNTTYQYYLTFEDYNNQFQIIADFKDIFSKSEFVNQTKKGSRLEIKIAKEDIKLLNTNSKIRLFEISNKNSAFLLGKESITQYNSKLLLIVGLILIISGITFIPLKKYWATK